MTRSEAYAEGLTEGRLIAERDISDGESVVAIARLRGRVMAGHKNDVLRAVALGIARGYRDTVARYEAGTYTREMFELPPVGGA